MTLFDTGIRPVIDDWLLTKSREDRDYGDYWSASSAGYCQRRVLFERLGVPHIKKEDDARKQRVFTAGHLFHNWIQEITKASGLSIAQELELQDEELMIRGHIDDLVLVSKDYGYDEKSKTTFIGDHLILYDYKTRNSRNFEYSKTLGHYHRMQLGTYMYMLRKRAFSRKEDGVEIISFGEEKITEARILNIEKDTLRMSEVQLIWDAQLEKDVKDYWTTLNAHYKASIKASLRWLHSNIQSIKGEQWIEYAKLLIAKNKRKSSTQAEQVKSMSSKEVGVPSTSKNATQQEENPIITLVKKDTQSRLTQLLGKESESIVLSWKKNLEDALKKENLYIILTELGLTTDQIIWSFGLAEYDMVSELAKLNATTAENLTEFNARTLPKCTCDKYDGGFMAKEKWNPFWYEGSPCSIELYKKWKKEQVSK